jgi:hypothetical protein
MKHGKITLILGCALVACLSSPLRPSAKPLTKSAIEGKKICWGKDWKQFSSGGKVTNNVAGEGTWSISKTGVISVNFPSGPFSGIVTESGDGSFIYSGSWIGTPKLTVGGGVYCN